jgi:hypothetical protein
MRHHADHEDLQHIAERAHCVIDLEDQARNPSGAALRVGISKLVEADEELLR